MTEDGRTEEDPRGPGEGPSHPERDLEHKGEALRLEEEKGTLSGQEPNRAAGSPASGPDTGEEFKAAATPPLPPGNMAAESEPNPE